MKRWRGIIRAGMLVWIAAVAMGCGMPRYAVGLDAVMTEELGRESEEIPNYRCTMGAHRGQSERYVENTLEAVAAAAKNPRFAFIEFDIQYTTDGIPVAFHDDRLMRVFGRMGKVRNLTYGELQELADGAIPAYTNIIEAVGRKRVNIEIKSQGNSEEDERLIDTVMADLEARGMRHKAMLSSISAEAVSYVKTRYPNMPAGQIYFLKASTYVHFDFLTERIYRDMAESQADYLILYVKNLRNIEDLLRFKPKGKTMMFWDFDETMYMVHKDLSDRLWGESGTRTFFRQMRYVIFSPFQKWFRRDTWGVAGAGVVD